MMGLRARQLVVVAFFVLLPAMAHAQASITGVVRDTSSAVLPGVTVEASSPALIEKVRTVLSDGSGQYRIVDLRPGTYTVTFTLRGFRTVKRDGIVLSGSFVAAVNADLQVGAIEETITVTGETPIVDVQSTTRERVLTKDLIDVLPNGRNQNSLAVLIPGVSTNAQDVGGSTAGALVDLTTHGGRASDQRQAVSGVSIGNFNRDGNQANVPPSLASIQEVAVDTGGASAELATGGVRVNFIPRDGGNTFAGSLFITGANTSMQSDNLTADLINRGVTAPTKIKNQLDVNPAFGGPIKRDKVWFWFAFRYFPSTNFVGNNFPNLNAGNPNSWTYAPDLANPLASKGTFRNTSIRLTWQLTPKNKLGVFADDQYRCVCRQASNNTSPEAQNDFTSFPMRPTTIDWAFPATNRLLIEATAFIRLYDWATSKLPPDPVQLIPVTEQSTGNYTYRGLPSYNDGSHTANYSVRMAASYITGAHATKVGFTQGWGHQFTNTFSFFPVAYRFNRGQPNQITENSNPVARDTSLRSELGIYAQDKWTVRRLTLNYGVRYDLFDNYEPAESLGPSPLTPARSFSFPKTEGVKWQDVTPKLGAAFDLFGNGKTAVKTSLNKYLLGLGLTGTFGQGWAPISTLVTSTTRSWTDRNGNFVPDCDLTNPGTQTVTGGDICGALADPNFGKVVPGVTYDPATLRGWGKRQSNWEFSAGVQQQLLTSLSVDVDYFRRWYANFTVTDNLALAASDFDRFSVVAPVNAELPGGGGQTISNLFDLNTTKFGVAAQNYLTFADTYGGQTEHWNGVDISLRGRTRHGLGFQAGIGTGKTTTDSCAVRAQVPESALLNPYCQTETPFLTQVKGFVTYQIPKVGVLVSSTYQDLPGPQVVGNVVEANADVFPSLKRNLSGGSNVTVNVVAPGAMYDDRLHQMDVRIGKVLRFGHAKANINLDIFNLANSNVALTENPSFTVFRQPQTILSPRLFKVSAQVDF